MKIALFIIWLILGLAELIFQKNISKFTFGCMWVVLMLELTKNLIN